MAIGLAITSAVRFSAYGETGVELGKLIINVICATTFLVHIIGPICVKFTTQRSGEVGMAKLGSDVWVSEGTAEQQQIGMIKLL
ncbi:MAG: hypothetical protein JSV61_07235 [Anaerolineales bacterium]|nr:MAG: hypothetical protein JSV61_07235 [Anaerolineales bacterium]